MTDRAERIQRMREGRREGAETGGERTETDGDATTESADAVETEAETSTASATADAEAMDSTATAETVDAETTDEVTAEATAGAATPAPEAREVDADEAALDAEVAAALDGMEVPDEVDVSVPEVTDADAEETADEERSTTDDETISVLEFVLGDERYCLDITFIEQIVERGSVTRIPNAPAFVEGVIDLRGDVTTVIDPKQTLATDEDGDGDLIVVFDSSGMDEEWNVGWAVDGVRRVSSVSLAEVKDSPVDEPWINGVVKRDDDDDGEFVIWTEPGELMQADDEESLSPNA